MIKKRSYGIEIRESEQSLSGYVFQFAEEIKYMGQRERFSPELKLELNPAGVFLFRDHNPERVLGREGENVSFELDSQGLKFSAQFIDTPLWKETRELIKKIS